MTLDEIKRLERLSALSSSEEDLASLVSDFEKIAGFVEQVRNADVGDADCGSRVLTIDDLRDDVVETSFDQQDILMNAPQKNDEAFIVPKVVE